MAQNDLRSTMKAADPDDSALEQVHERSRLPTSLKTIRPESRHDLPVEVAVQKKTAAEFLGPHGQLAERAQQRRTLIAQDWEATGNIRRLNTRKLGNTNAQEMIGPQQRATSGCVTATIVTIVNKDSHRRT